jgi:hypothetical protein
MKNSNEPSHNQANRNPLLKRLASLRRKVRFLDGWLGICAVVALVLGVGVAEGVLDFWVHVPSLFRAVLLVGLLVGSGYVAYRYIFTPFSKPCDDLNLALRIEDAYPELNDALATTVQFLRQPKDEQARVGGSAAMRERTVAETMEKASNCDFGRILDRRAAVLFGAGACCILLVAGMVVGMNPYYSGIAFRRFVEPFGQHTWTRITVARQKAVEMLDQPDEDKKWAQLNPREKDVIAIGRPYFIKVNLEGQMPRRPEAKIEIKGQVRSEKTVPLQISADKKSAWFSTAIDMTQQYQTFKFRILANDGSFPPRAGSWHEVEVLPPPKLIDLDGQPSPQITIYPPAYTDLKSPHKLDPGNKHLDLIAGTNVVLRGRADRSLKEAWIEYRPENPNFIAASVLTLLGQTDPLQAAAQAAGGNAVWGRIPARLEDDGATFQVTFMPWVTGDYVLNLRDFDKLEHQAVGNLRVNLDPVPGVKLIEPRASLTRVPGGKINFKFLVTDEQFAAKSVCVEYRRKTADGESFEQPSRTILYDARQYGKLLPAMLARASLAPIAGANPLLGKSPVQGPDLRLRWKKLEFETVWSLRNQFDVGDLVVIEVCADDFCDIYPTREPGRSHAIEVRIISKTDMKRKAERDVADILKQVQDVAKIQQKALDAVKETRKQEKIDQKARENFLDNAEAPQRDVQERVDNLRRDIKEVRKTLQDNLLTDASAYRDADKIQGTLDSIAQKELQEIPPKLADARTDLAKNDKNSPETNKKLDQAGKLQDSVVKSLNELIKELNPEAKMQGFRNEVRDLGQKQKNLTQDNVELNAKKQAVDNNPALTPKDRKNEEAARKDKIDKNAKEQQEIADQTNKLLKEMKDAREEFQKDGDKQNADKLKEAIEKLEAKEKDKKKPDPMKVEPKEPLATEMKKIADDMKQKRDARNDTIEKQKNVAKKLDEVLESLEGRSENALKQEIDDRQKVEKKLDDIDKKLQKLRDDTKKAELIEDKEERLKKKKELAEQHADLQKEIEKTRRELARLNEQRAANELGKAADKVEEAGEKLRNGQNPEAEQNQAQKDIKNAKKDVKQAEEELARELLVKMADQLEGLKIRQVASRERSESLHSKIMQRKSWTEPLLDTMDGNIEAQKGIGEETDLLKEKLKEAKIFHSILEKAKKSMDEAGKIMEIRRDDGKDRRYLEKGEKMPADELKEEVERHDETVKHQKQAVKRLDILLDSIKEEIAKMNQKKEQQAKNENPDDPPKEDEQQGGMRAQDGIPPMAQLKVLRAEQLDLNERTEDFAKRNPDLKKLDDDQKKLLEDLSAEQSAIHSLFLELTAQPEPAEQPEPKEKKGEPK